MLANFGGSSYAARNCHAGAKRSISASRGLVDWYPLTRFAFSNPHGVNRTPSPFGDSLYKQRESSVARGKTLKGSPITKLCFVIAFSPFGRRTSFPNRREESLHFERRREISELHPLAHLTLRLLSYILSVVVLSCSFGAQKNEKARHRTKLVITAFCSRAASSIPRSAVICHKQLFVKATGAKELALHAITATR